MDIIQYPVTPCESYEDLEGTCATCGLTEQEHTGDQDPSEGSFNPRPWWRHWHIEGHTSGFNTRREAEAGAMLDIQNAGWLGRLPEIVRCDIDHSKQES